MQRMRASNDICLHSLSPVPPSYEADPLGVNSIMHVVKAAAKKSNMYG